MNTNLVKTVCYGIAIAMGVAVIVTNFVNPLPAAGIGTLLSVAVAALGIAGLQK
jgi:hypothetical protein